MLDCRLQYSATTCFGPYHCSPPNDDGREFNYTSSPLSAVSQILITDCNNTYYYYYDDPCNARVTVHNSCNYARPRV